MSTRTQGTLYEGEVIGAVNEQVIRKAQIRATILAHIEKERKLFRQGIKCLSLFFIDHVDNYREADGGKGIYAQIFEEEYERIVGELQLRFNDDPEYIKYLKSFLIRYMMVTSHAIKRIMWWSRRQRNQRTKCEAIS